MNKQEVIEKIEASKRPFVSGKTFDHALDIALNIVKQLDEPEKPVVPRFVADYIDSEQYSCSTLSEALDNMDDEKRILDWFYINSETFAKAWLYGYEVEKEKLYIAKNKITNSYLGKDGGWSHYGRACSPEIIKHSKSTWRSLGVWDNDLYEITEVKDD